MNYQETIEWLFHRLPMYQRQGSVAFSPGLENIKTLSFYLGEPQKKFKSVHIGGTNGKGSTAHILASIFQEAGYKTGIYSSPHLKDFRERIKINGLLIPKKWVVDFIARNKAFIEERGCSFFELCVGMAFAYFAEEEVDIALVEVGMGGRLDATNILLPELSIITNIGLDHTQFLGGTLAEIAGEKAGIIKPEIPVVIGEYDKQTEPVFKDKAQRQNADLYEAYKREPSNHTTDLKGHYQQKNLTTSLMAIDVLRQKNWNISENAVNTGLKNIKKNTDLVGRYSILNREPTIIADTAHNVEGLTQVIEQILQEKFKRLFIVFGIVNDKNTDRTFPILPEGAAYFYCKPDVPRGMPVEGLCASAKKHGRPGKACPSVQAALSAARENASAEDLILICGSTFTVAEII